ncbi:MAG: nucleotide exchange factor GrpE [Actinomycetota bacterium]|nr:nucleotide exchange factor GrpE [Actinomycetota bacterium]MDG2120459.1 nucleotide exchange factor GrpE [Actinomycetota bacterium]
MNKFDDDSNEQGSDSVSEINDEVDNGFNVLGEAEVTAENPSQVTEIQEIFPENIVSVEDLVESLEQVNLERDELRENLQRLQADYENFRRRSLNESNQRIAAGLSRIAEALLPVLDACDAALTQGLTDVVPVQASLESVLQKEGLCRIQALGEVFDPNKHEAVMHESGDGGEQIVVEELRSGFWWGEKVLRAAMVKVRD